MWSMYDVPGRETVIERTFYKQILQSKKLKESLAREYNRLYNWGGMHLDTYTVVRDGFDMLF